jgi:hypothetical protein
MTQKESQARFVAALRDILREDRALSAEEMASRFADDGLMGTEMRNMLLHGTQEAA